MAGIWGTNGKLIGNVVKSGSKPGESNAYDANGQRIGSVRDNGTYDGHGNRISNTRDIGLALPKRT